MSAEEMMAAVNAGIAEANGDPAPAKTDTTGEGDDLGTDGTDTGAVGEGSADEGGDDTGADGEGGEAADGSGSADDAEGGAPDGAAAADGKVAVAATAAAPGGKKPGDGAAGKDGEPGAAAGGKAPDPLNDPLPNALKRETKERINTLIDMVKTRTADFERVNTEHQEVLGYIKDTGASPQQFADSLTYLRLVNSPNPADKEAALGIMQREIAALARIIGKPVPGVNMLEGHDDLIADVGAGRLSMERAAEIAAGREQRAFQQRQAQGAQQHDQETQAMAQARTAAKNQLDALDTTLRRDPDYARKRPIVVAQMKPIFAQLHPSQWAGAFKNAWDALGTLPPAAARQAAPAAGKVPANTPLRPGNPAGAAIAAPKSMAEAIDAGIAMAGRR